MVHDSAYGFLVGRSMQRGSPPNTTLTADTSKISVDKPVFIAAWSPGQYAVPLFFEKLGLTLGRSALLTSALFSALGVAGLYFLFLTLGFSKETALWSLALIASQRYFARLFLEYHGGEILLFGATPWILLFALRHQDLAAGAMAALLALFLTGFFFKTAFAIGAAAILLSLWLIETFPKDCWTRRSARYAARACGLFLVFYALVHFGFMSRGWNQTRRVKGVGFTPQQISLEATYQLYMMLPWAEARLPHQAYPFAGRTPVRKALLRMSQATHTRGYRYALSLLLMALLYALARRNPDRRYLLVVAAFSLTYTLAFVALCVVHGEAMLAPRHFRPVSLLLIPGAVGLLQSWPRRWPRRAIFAAGILLCLYEGGVCWRLYRMRGARLALGQDGLSHNGYGRKVPQYEESGLAMIHALDKSLPPGNNLFYITDPALSLEITRSRILMMEPYGGLLKRKFRGKVDNLVVLLPVKYIENGTAHVALDCFIDMPQKWETLRTPSLVAFYQGPWRPALSP